MNLAPATQARIDQLDALVDEAVDLVLRGLRATDEHDHDLVADLSAMNVGVALRHYVNDLDDDDRTMLAIRAVVRLAEERTAAHPDGTRTP